MTARKWRIMLVDDHAIVRDGLTMLIDSQHDMEVIAQAEDGRAAIELASIRKPDVMVLDFSLPYKNGAQVAAEVRRLLPEVRIVALTRHGEAAYVRQLLNAGARGYLLKQAAVDELITAIRAVASGGTYLDPTLVDHAVTQFVASAQTNRQLHSQLSDRETEVVRLTAFGYSNKEIATQLYLSVKTVDTYKMRAIEKLGLHGRAAIVRYAVEQGWFDQS